MVDGARPINGLRKVILFGGLIKPADVPWGNKRGLPKKDWVSYLKDDCERVGLKWPAEATDRAKWLKRIESLLQEEIGHLLLYYL